MDINTSFYCCHHKTFFSACLLAAPPTTHHRHCWLFFHSVSISFHQMVIGVMLYAISLLEEIDSRHQPSPLLLLLMLDARFDGYFWEKYLPEKENFSRYFFSLNSLRRSGIYNEDEISFFSPCLRTHSFSAAAFFPLCLWRFDLRIYAAKIYLPY